MKFRKISILATAAALVATMFTGCGSKVDEEQKLLDSAAGAIVLSGYTQVTANMLAPKQVTKDGKTFEVTYTTESKSITINPWDETRVKIVFDRPSATESAEAYTLTGTVSSGDKKASKTLSGYIMPLSANLKVVSTVDDTVAAYKAAGADIEILFTGVVDCVLSNGYYWVRELKGEDHLYVYKTASADDVKLGDKIQINGPLTKYYSQYEVKATAAVDILQRGADITRTATKITAAELYALNDSDYSILGKLYNVDLRVVQSGNYINFQVPEDATKVIQGYKGDDASLKAYAGQVVNIDVVFYTTNNHRVTYTGGKITPVA